MGFFRFEPPLKIFEGIDDAVVHDIIQHAPRNQFMPGEVIMEQGDFPDGKGYILMDGLVDVWVDGKETTTLGKGEIFGEFALLNEEPRSATIVTKNPVEVLILSKDILFNMIEHDNNSINKEIIRRMEENLEAEEANE